MSTYDLLTEDQKEARREAVRRYRAQNIEQVRQKNREHKKSLYTTREGRQLIAETQKRTRGNYTGARRAELSAYLKEWRAKNKHRTDVYLAAKNELNRTDPCRRLVRRLRNRLRNALIWAKTREFKSASTMELVGAEKKVVMEHIENLFLPGMSWENMGEWHVDHVKPCASFDLSNPEQQKQCFHYTNLQPLWALDNLSKGDKELEQKELH